MCLRLFQTVSLGNLVNRGQEKSLLLVRGGLPLRRLGKTHGFPSNRCKSNSKASGVSPVSPKKRCSRV
jgi:hypothetical protein